MDEKITFDALNLSDNEAKYIEISRKGVHLRFSLRHSTAAPADFQRMMTEFWDEEVEKGGVSLKARLDGLSEAEFFKEATTMEEVRGAVLSLIKLKRRFGIA